MPPTPKTSSRLTVNVETANTASNPASAENINKRITVNLAPADLAKNLIIAQFRGADVLGVSCET